MFHQLARSVLLLAMRIYFSSSTCVFLSLLWVISPACALPSLDASADSAGAVLNELYSVVYDVSWSGDPGQYSSVPPALEIGDWAVVSGVTTSSFLLDGRNVIRHVIAILPREVGEFSIPEAEVPYFSPSDMPESPAKADDDEDTEVPEVVYPVLHAGLMPVVVREPEDIRMTIVMFTGLGIVLFTFASVFYRRRAVQMAQTPGHLVMTVPSMIHDARKHRLDQDYYGFFQGLMRGAGLLKNAVARGRLQKQYENSALSIGYKGGEVSDADMDAAIAELETAYRSDDAGRS